MNIRRLLYSIFLGIISFGEVMTQNLVPNPGFELHDSCPMYGAQLSLSSGWYAPTTGTSDYLNACCTNIIMGIPYNFFGYQPARSGTGYAGFYPSYDYYYREYLSIKLLDTLHAGTYTVSFYVSLADWSGAAINNIGCYFSSDSIYSNNYYKLNYSPQFENPQIIADTANWTLISGQFEAAGGEQYLTIGNFKDSADIDELLLNAAIGHICYYYIDDVSVTSYVSTEPSLSIPNVFTPNGDGVNDVFVVQADRVATFSCEVYDRWGVRVFAANDPAIAWNGKSGQGDDCSVGAYFYFVRYTGLDGKIYTRKGTLSLFR